MSSESTIYEIIGGAPTIQTLVNHFYNQVAADPDLRPIFPDDFSEVRARQYAFLTQFFGGPALYSEQYGAPMLRYRHQPFPITYTRVQAWLRCMSRALELTGIEPVARDFMFDRLTRTAHHMKNTPAPGDEEGTHPPGIPLETKYRSEQ